MAKLDLKRNWPLVGAAGLGVLALLALRSGQGGGSQLVPVPPAGAAGSAPVGGGGMDPTTASLANDILQYEAAVAGTTASEYGTYIGANAADFQGTIQGQIAESQAYAAAEIANAQRPSWLQQFTGFINAAANAYATYQSGGLYRAPQTSYQEPASYYPPQSGWPSTYPGGYRYLPGYPTPSTVA